MDLTLKFAGGILWGLLAMGIGAVFLRDALWHMRAHAINGKRLTFWASVDIVLAVFFLSVVIRIAFKGS